MREVREPRDRVEGDQERCHQLKLQGLWTQLLPRDEAQAHHLHRQGTNFICLPFFQTEGVFLFFM